jgi:hypothetical protein
LGAIKIKVKNKLKLWPMLLMTNVWNAN